MDNLEQETNNLKEEIREEVKGETKEEINNKNEEEESIAVSYKTILQQKEYVKYIASNLINRFGDSIDSVAFSWMIYLITNSATWSAIIFGINRVPSVLLQPIAGAIVENMSKKRVMIMMDIIRGVCVGLVALLYIFHLLTPYILIGITIIISSAEAFRNPCTIAFLPKILKKDYYEYGMSLNTSLSTLMELAGLGLGGVIIAIGGVQVAILIDASTFFLCASMIAMIHIKEEKTKKVFHIMQIIQGFKEGVIYVKRNKVIISYLLITFLINGLLVPMNSLQAPLVKEVYGQGEIMLSVLGIGTSIGMLIGSLLYPKAAARFSNKILMMIGGCGIGVYTFSLIVIEPLKNMVLLLYGLVAGMSILSGIGIAMMISVLNIGVVKNVNQEYMSRVGAILGSVAVAAIPIVSFLISIVLKFTSIQIIFLVTGISTVLLFLSFIFNKKLII